MAKVGWLGSVAMATGAAAIAAAAQYGLAYGLEIVAWAPRSGVDPAVTPDDVWQSALGWTTWIAATSTAIGAIVADRLASGSRTGRSKNDAAARDDSNTDRKPGAVAVGMWRALLAVTAAIGALAVVGLVIVPARHAVRANTSTPEFIAAAYAIIGIVVGIVVAIWALMSRAGKANVVTSAIWFWLVGLAAVVTGVLDSVAPGSVPLAGWPLRDGFYVSSTWSLPGGLMAFGSALVIGVGAAARSAHRGDHRLATSLSGALGPGLVAVAYLVAQPPRGSSRDSAVSAAVLAPWATLLGLVASTLIVGIYATRAKRVAERSKADTYDVAWAHPHATPQPAGAAPAMGRARPVGAGVPLHEEATVPVGAQRSGDDATQEVAAAVPGSQPVPAPAVRKPQPNRRHR